MASASSDEQIERLPINRKLQMLTLNLNFLQNSIN
jgi:hypothetical protein